MAKTDAGFLAARGSHLIAHIDRKAMYREDTDATFERFTPRPRDAYLGILGPVIGAEVEAAEGGDDRDGIPAVRKPGGSVAPGRTFTDVCQAPPRAGAGPNDSSSILWRYHSHAHELADLNTGLIGAIIVTRTGTARPDATPKDLDRECVALCMAERDQVSP
jgi:hypothetical protein